MPFDGEPSGGPHSEWLFLILLLVGIGLLPFIHSAAEQAHPGDNGLAAAAEIVRDETTVAHFYPYRTQQQLHVDPQHFRTSALPFWCTYRGEIGWCVPH